MRKWGVLSLNSGTLAWTHLGDIKALGVNQLFDVKSASALDGEKIVKEMDYQLKYAIFSTACSIVYKHWTRPISKQFCIQGYLRILWLRNKKSSKTTELLNVMFHV